MGQALWAELGQDAWEQLVDALDGGVAGDAERVGGDGSLDLWLVKVDHLAVGADHVDLLDTGDVVDAKLLQGAHQLFVIRGRALVNALLPAAGSALPAQAQVSACVSARAHA